MLLFFEIDYKYAQHIMLTKLFKKKKFFSLNFKLNFDFLNSFFPENRSNAGNGAHIHTTKHRQSIVFN